MKRRRIGPWLVVGMPGANVVAWVLFSPADDGRDAFARQVIAEMLATTTVVLFAIALLLSTRARFLEPYFGGLDKMYRSHREASVAGFLLLVVHVVTVPWRLEPGGGVPAGLISFAGFVVLVILSLGPRLRITRRWVTLGYRSWKRTHRLIGLFFIFACAHMFLVDPLVLDAPVQLAIVFAAFVVGIASYLYGLTLARLIRPIRRYVVESVSRLNQNTAEVVLTPRKRHLDQTPGQFVFVRFKKRRLRESHPFTVASAPHDGTLKLVIKASGDYTTRLIDSLTPGVKALLEGSYGMLDHRTGSARQLWIAGGIGVTPFLSWLRDSDIAGDVDFFYAVRHPEDALFADEIAALTEAKPNVRFHLNVSSRDGTLTSERVTRALDGDVDDVSVYMCGPVGMIHSFEDELVGSGLSQDQVHYEEFSFR